MRKNLNLNMFEHLMCQCAVHSMPQVGSLQDFPSLTQIHGGSWHIYIYTHTCNSIFAIIPKHIQCNYITYILHTHFSQRNKNKQTLKPFPPIFQPQILVTHRRHLLPEPQTRDFTTKDPNIGLETPLKKSCFWFP